MNIYQKLVNIKPGQLVGLVNIDQGNIVGVGKTLITRYRVALHEKNHNYGNKILIGPHYMVQTFSSDIDHALDKTYMPEEAIAYGPLEPIYIDRMPSRILVGNELIAEQKFENNPLDDSAISMISKFNNEIPDIAAATETYYLDVLGEQAQDENARLRHKITNGAYNTNNKINEIAKKSFLNKWLDQVINMKCP